MDNSTGKPGRSPDGVLVDQLAKSGSDLSRLHEVQFTLRFPSQGAAERADLQLLGLAFKTKIEPGKTAEERVIRATKVMYPVEPDLEGLREKLNTIAAGARGAYEGWSARINQPAGRNP
jgi:hypothetical protein